MAGRPRVDELIQDAASLIAEFDLELSGNVESSDADTSDLFRRARQFLERASQADPAISPELDTNNDLRHGGPVDL